MNEYLATMVARSEHQVMQQSLRTVRDFEAHAALAQPTRAAKVISGFSQWMSSTLNGLRERSTVEHVKQVKRTTHTFPQVDNG
jgi:hypothetical protein